MGVCTHHTKLQVELKLVHYGWGFQDIPPWWLQVATTHEHLVEPMLVHIERSFQDIHLW